jgi:hypothetical protein
VLSDDELRARLADLAAPIGADPERAPKAIRAAHRRRRRQRVRRGTGALLAVAAVTASVLILNSTGQPRRPAAEAAIDCNRGGAVTNTPLVAASADGPVVLVRNNEGRPVVLRFGSEQSVLPPGLTEMQLPVGAGRYRVECVAGDSGRRVATVRVVEG